MICEEPKMGINKIHVSIFSKSPNDRNIRNDITKSIVGLPGIAIHKIDRNSRISKTAAHPNYRAAGAFRWTAKSLCSGNWMLQLYIYISDRGCLGADSLQPPRSRQNLSRVGLAHILESTKPEYYERAPPATLPTSGGPGWIMMNYHRFITQNP